MTGSEAAIGVAIMVVCGVFFATGGLVCFFGQRLTRRTYRQCSPAAEQLPELPEHYRLFLSFHRWLAFSETARAISYIAAAFYLAFSLLAVSGVVLIMMMSGE